MGSYDATSEVRFGVVLYGGVSLAIYMNGVAQELYRLVRATAPMPDVPGELRWTDAELRGSEPVYRELGARLGAGPALADTGDAVRTRFVVDLLTGASAGGINGVYLAKALANDADLGPLEQLWIQRGDLAKLLHDGPAAKDLRRAGLRPGDRTSLLNSRWMYRELLDAMRRVVPPSPRTTEISPYAEAIDLWVSTTDLEGRVGVVDTNDSPAGRVVERSHRTLLHFAYADERAIGGELRNDFTAADDAALAFAARATSSFPGAFEPVRLGDIDPVIDALYQPPAVPPRRSRDLERHFPQYAEGEAARHSFADGGYLDNKPFEQILRTLPLRRATLPVKRIVLYVEPDPGAPPLVAEGEAPRPDLLATVLAAVTTPRNETVGNDVAQIRGFGTATTARIDAWRELTGALDDELERRSDAAASEQSALLTRLRTADLTDAERDALADLLDDWSPTASAYRRARAAVVERDMAALLARTLPASPQAEGSKLHVAMSALVARMRHDPPYDDATTMLQHFDTRFQLQRINFLQRRAVDAVVRPARIGIDADDALRVEDAQRVRRDLDTVFGVIRRLTREVRRPRSVPDANPCAAQVDAVVAAFAAAGVEVSPPPGGAFPSAAALVAAYEASAAVRDALAALLRAVDLHLRLGVNVREAWRAITNRAVPVGLRRELQRRWILYRFYDEAGRAFDQLPGETSDIDIYRVSPLDASALVPDLGTRHEKLAGGAVHHFGAFFAESWRRNDLLWGRLDAAERIIEAIVASVAPDTPGAARADLVARAQRAILAEAWVDGATREQVLAPVAGLSSSDAARQATLPDDLDPTRGRTRLAVTPRTPQEPGTRTWMGLAARSLRVANDVTTDLGVGALDRSPATVYASRVVKLVANALEFVAGDGLRTVLVRNFLVLLAVTGFVTGVVGTIAREPAVSRSGWTLFAACLLIRVVADAVADRVGRRHGVLRYLLRVSTLIVVAGAVGGVIVLHHNVAAWRPVLYTGAPALVLLLLGLLTNKRVAPWKVALAALAGTLVLLAAYGVSHLDDLWRVLRGDAR